jgi:hypothetical protein
VIGPLIGLFFGLLWLLVGASATGAATIPIIVAGVFVFALAAWRVVRRGGRRGRFHRGYYAAAVVLEVAAIMAAQAWLAAHGRDHLLFPVVGVIVGLHFIGLWLASSDRRFLWLTGGLVVINGAALLLPLSHAGRVMLSGFGSAAALLAAASA